MKTKHNKIAFFTLGCKVNFSETSFLSDEVEKQGFQKVGFREVADIYVIHSCILTGQAEKKTRNAASSAHRKNPKAKIIIMGCVSQLKAEELLQLPGVSHVLGNESKFKLADILKDFSGEKKMMLHDDVHTKPTFNISWSLNDRTRSFLKIQDGCDCYCNYCIVPYARGKSRSADISQVLDAVEQITAAGFQEIVLTGINLGDFGKDSGGELPKLLVEMQNIENLKRIRISSLEPQHFTQKLYEELGSLPKVMPHYHIPLQSGHDDTLKRMGRTYTTKDIELIFKQLKTINPDACFAADVIAGFPGETEEEFRQGLDFLKSLPLSYMHVFTYSARKDTKAADFSDQVHPLEKKRRTARLLEVSAAMKNRFYLNAQGQTRKILAEHENKKGFMYGYTDNYIRVKIPFDKSLNNKLIDVQLIEFSNPESVYRSQIINVYET
jgi:threonylcarbamoyladenosine tRNA methylthiotransferase MtaB